MAEESTQLVDRLALKAGYTYAITDEHNTNGGIDNINHLSNNGLGISASIIFNSSLSNYFQPYLDLAFFSHDDRRFIIPGIGIYHRILIDDSRFEPFYSFGVGYNYAKWDESPVEGINSTDDTGESITFTAKSGFDFYFTEHFAFDLTLRYDAYDISTTLVENNKVTRINDNGSISLLAGIAYRFGEQKTKAPIDDDQDGVINANDRCPETIRGVPVNEAGCPQYRFTFNLHHGFAQYKISQLKDLPHFDTIAFMKKNTQYNVRIIGYTDSTGSEKFNQKLAYKRAEEARKFLTDHGIEHSRVEIISRGEHESFIKNDSKENRSLNRRILIEFYRTQTGIQQ